ncbi:MAG TPA: ABC-F family ATP-binding cassette domain-containing protein, partial [Chlamydiales bacterium]|nr:ABC-F family ATP-binding cassette domain-containing protein [Chlamydiales bacterium]
SVNQGDIFAIVGENGSGKTTLLKLLGGLALPDKGDVSLMPNLTIGFLPQEVIVTDSTLTVRSYIETGKFSDLERKMAEALENNQLEEWSELHDQYEHLGGYRRIPIEKVLVGLKLETDLLDRSLSDLSGGQKTRAALAKALIENPDLLLLDEPTNHLDAEMLKYLEDALSARNGATVIVSHDRKFINAVCNHIVEIKEGKLTCYGGNYDFYLAERERQIEKQLKSYEAWEEERRSLKQKMKAFTFSKGKATPPTDKNIMAYDLRGGGFQKSEARRLDTLKARLEELETHPCQHPMPKSITGLKFSPTPLASAVAVELEEVGKSFGKKVLFSHFSKLLSKGDRIVLSGANGTGKTTLLKCIAGIFPVDQGHIRLAPTAKIAYLDQEIDQFPMEQTPLTYFATRFQFSEEDVRRELHKAALGGVDLLNRPFSLLSVGQRKRLMLLTIILEKPNVLLLDEPTNHLDFSTLEALEKALLHFEGAILAVSHDLTFIEKIATDTWELYY